LAAWCEPQGRPGAGAPQARSERYGKAAPTRQPLEKISGRVTYSQQILKEFGWITEGRGRGVETRGSGYSET